MHFLSTRLLAPIILIIGSIPLFSQAAPTCDQLFERVVEFQTSAALFRVRPALENSTLDISNREGWDFTLTERSIDDTTSTALIRTYLWPNRFSVTLRKLATWTRVESVKAQLNQISGVFSYSISRLAKDRGNEIQTDLVFSINRNGDYASVRLTVDTSAGPLVDFKYEPTREELVILTYNDTTKDFRKTVYHQTTEQSLQRISLELKTTRALSAAEAERLSLVSH